MLGLGHGGEFKVLGLRSFGELNEPKRGVWG